MKNIGILTLYYQNYNYGGQLQAYALQRAVEKMGYTSKQISFQRRMKEVFWRKIRAILRDTMTEKKKILYRSLGKIRRQKGSGLDNSINTIKKFDDFIENIPHTKIVTSDNIFDLNKQIDVFIVGSDQVWNPEFVPLSFFLDFAAEGKRRISYAASIRIKGYEYIEGKKIKKELDKFDYISVREKSAKNILRKIGVEKEINLVADPTFLLDATEWDALCEEVDIRGKYIFVYLITDINILQKIEEYAFMKNMKVVSVQSPGVEAYTGKNFVKFADGIGPKEFLYLIKNAYYVIVESFHGIAFSIIYKKQFIVFGELQYDDRKKTILERFDLVERCVKKDSSFIEILERKIECSRLDRELKYLRNESLNYLNRVLS